MGDKMTTATLALSPSMTSRVTPMGFSRVVPLTGMSVPEMQDTLKMFGVAPSPMQKLALTQFAATRDPSLRAQVSEELRNLDPATQAKVHAINKDIVVRASQDYGAWQNAIADWQV